jgi:hypothetical protein
VHVKEPADSAEAASNFAVRPTRAFRILAGVSARRIRGVSLLGSLILVLVASTLAATRVLPWWSFPVAVLVLLADLVWLRRAAVSERDSRRASQQSPESATGFADQAVRGPTYFQEESAPTAETVSEPAAPRAVEIAEPIEAAPVDPSAWAPVPVPPPTYTLKAKAADPVVAPVIVSEHGEAEPLSLDGMFYDCDLDELVQRRSATGA